MAACAGGDGGTGPGGLTVSLQVPATITGSWSSGQAGSMLLCRPDLTMAATGEGRATWTGGSGTFSADYGTYPATYTAADVAQITGVDGISAGQSAVVAVPKAGYASFRYALTVNYTVAGTGRSGSANAAFDCKAPDLRNP
jgi:hypothetical protein